MKDRSALIAVLLLLSGNAGADSDGLPSLSATAIWSHIEQQVAVRIQQRVDANLERALHSHHASSAALRVGGDCRVPVDLATLASRSSASEIHRQLVACLAKQRANGELFATNMPPEGLRRAPAPPRLQRPPASWSGSTGSR